MDFYTQIANITIHFDLPMLKTSFYPVLLDIGYLGFFSIVAKLQIIYLYYCGLDHLFIL
jgi:hypothetical protein